jgi:hypothetical protein
VVVELVADASAAGFLFAVVDEQVLETCAESPGHVGGMDGVGAAGIHQDV